jgi:hypothetical protein
MVIARMPQETNGMFRANSSRNRDLILVSICKERAAFATGGTSLNLSAYDLFKFTFDFSTIKASSS